MKTKKEIILVPSHGKDNRLPIHYNGMIGVSDEELPNNKKKLEEVCWQIIHALEKDTITIENFQWLSAMFHDKEGEYGPAGVYYHSGTHISFHLDFGFFPKQDLKK